jgi:hypothetical protein
MKKRELLELMRSTPPPLAEMQHALSKAFLTCGLSDGKKLTATNLELNLIDKPAAKKANK